MEYHKAKTKDGRECEVLEVVTYRRRNVHVRFKDGSEAWIPQEDFNPRLPNEVPPQDDELGG